MLFKGLVALAAVASMATGAAVERRGVASCVFVATPVGSVTPGTDLVSEFNFQLGTKIGRAFPNTTFNSLANTTVAGASGGPFTIDKSFVFPATVSDADLTTTLTSWAGETLPAAFAGTAWVLNSVTC